MLRRRWWNDCRLWFMNHFTGYAAPHSLDGRDADGYLFRCHDCGHRWSLKQPG